MYGCKGDRINGKGRIVKMEIGYIEYRAMNDKAVIMSGGSKAEFSGAALRSMRDALNKILDE
jgi:hypothetical protein